MSRLLLMLIALNVYGYEWIQNIDIYDTVCAISYNGNPLSIGVFFDLNLVLTSATPIEPYINDLDSLKVHAIHGAWNKHKEFPVTCAVTPYAKNRRDYWVPLGMDDKHSGIHDLMILYARSNESYHLAPEPVNASARHAFSSFLARPEYKILPRGFHVPGFGYIDEDHVKKMDDLEVEYFGNPAILDCDDYIPRNWGRFICILNLRNTTGVQSGAPLIQRNLIYGVASFALEKGEEKIYVFTDIRDYVLNWNYCFDASENTYYRWVSRYWG